MFQFLLFWDYYLNFELYSNFGNITYLLNFEQKSIKNMDIEVVLSFRGQNFVNQINHSMLFCWNKKKSLCIFNSTSKNNWEQKAEERWNLCQNGISATIETVCKLNKW